VVKGFSIKHDSGKIRVWGWLSKSLTGWEELGGPIIGFRFEGEIGD